MSGISEADHGSIVTLVDRLKQQPGALLPILHAIQAQLGYIPPAAIDIIASALLLSRAEIQGVISFYHHFRSTPPGQHQLHICRAEACQARGARELEQHVQTRLGIGYHQSTSDQRYSLEPAYCLGNCACGPTVRVNDDIVGRVDPQRFEQLLEQLEQLSEPKQRSEQERQPAPSTSQPQEPK